MKRHGSMNHLFRLVWSHVLNGWVAVAEKTRGRGKGARRKLIAAAVASLAGWMGSDARAAPAGAQVMAGAGSIAQSGATTTITQTSQNLALNWKSFNIAAQETVNFIQPSAAAIAVNRIIDTNGTQILGHLTANGQVYLINPNGVLFGQGAQVNVGGLVASTLDLNDANSSGASKSFSGNGSGSVVNQGAITAANYVALLGNQVRNQGVISAQLGSVALGAGNAATLTFSGTRLVGMRVDQSVLNSLAENSGLIQADGGQVIMTAGARDALQASVVNNTGVILARTMEEHDGVITLLGGMTAGSVHVGGTLDASAPVGGNGGAIETSAAHVNVADSAKITTVAAKGKTGRWLINPLDFTIAATGGDISGALLSNQLASNAITIVSSQGASAGLGNINVNDDVTWSANNLTLSAANNIYVNAAMHGGAAGSSASLTLMYGQHAAAADNTSNYYVRAPISLPSGPSFQSVLGNNGMTKIYTVITSLGMLGDATTAPATATLQSMAGISASNLSGYYALGADIDASPTSGSGYSANSSGFKPIGDNDGHPFAGVFEGFGHTISNLYINKPDASNIGLFGNTSGVATIKNLILSNPKVVGDANVGALVGNNAGSILNDSIVSADIGGRAYVGGLVGNNTATGMLLHDYTSSGTVNGAYTHFGIINPATTSLGGLVGYNAGSIDESYSNITVFSGFGYNSIGGLVGQNNNGMITDSYSIGQVTGRLSVGGLVGANLNGKITRSYAAGLVTGDSGSSNLGGLIGSNLGGTLQNNFWDIDATQQSTSAGTGTAKAAGMSSLQMQSKVNFTAATNANGGTSPGWIFQTVAPAAASVGPWFNYDGHTDPLLTYFMTPLAVSINNNVGAIYNGKAYSDAAGVTYSVSPTNPANLAGSLNYSYNNNGVMSPVINAASYTATPAGLYSNQQGYIISYLSGALTINPAPLTASASSKNKVYDGNTSATTALTITNGLVAGETVTATGTGGFNTKDVLTANVVTVNSTTLANGTGGGLASNYSLASGEIVNANITPKALSATASASNKTYDGSTAATPAPALTLASAGLVNGETVTATGTGSFNTKDVLTANLVTVNSTTLANGAGGGLASNYSLASGEIANANITPKALSATASASNKTYDGSTAATAALTIACACLVNGETVTATATGSFNTKDVLTANLITINSTTLANGAGGGLASNYSLASGETALANILPKALSATASASSKTYDGSTAATPAPTLTLASAGLVNGETVTATATGSFNAKDVATANLVTVNSTTLANGANGGLASNYSLASGETASANITAQALSASIAAFSKAYDGTTSATPTFTIDPHGLVGNETVVATGSANFNSKDVSTARQISVTGVGLLDGTQGGLASNYSLSGGQSGAASIIAKQLTASLARISQVYDGTTTVTPTLTITNGLVGTETVSATGTASLNSKDVDTAKFVTLNSTALFDGANGGRASNYRLAPGQTALATLTKATLLYTATAANALAGQTPQNLSGAVSGLVAGDTLAGSTTGALTWTTTATAASPAGSYPINGGGLLAVDYSTLNLPSNATALTLHSVSSPTLFSNVSNVAAMSRSTQMRMMKSTGSANAEVSPWANAILPTDPPGTGDLALTGRDIINMSVEVARDSMIKMGPLLMIKEAPKFDELAEKDLLNVHQ